MARFMSSRATPAITVEPGMGSEGGDALNGSDPCLWGVKEKAPPDPHPAALGSVFLCRRWTSPNPDVRFGDNIHTPTQQSGS